MNVLMTQRIGKDKHNCYYDYLESNYVKYFNQFNINLVILPNNVTDVIDFYNINRCNKIILTGGDDISESLYSNKSIKIDKNLYQRDLNEKKLINFSVKNKIPLLGICRGFQIINVCLGGDLTQDLTKISNYKNTDKHTIIFSDKFIKKMQVESLQVNSYHNQGISIDQLSEDLELIAFNKKDNIVEMYKHKKLDIYGIQWHPERVNAPKVFDYKFITSFLKI